MKPGYNAIIIGALAIAGCATDAPVTPSSRLRGPASWAMEVAPALADPKPGDDAKALLGQCRAEYAAQTGKLPALQSFARRVTKQQSQPSQ